jgi:ribonuclease HI
MNKRIANLFFDGGSRGNPGQAAGAAVIITSDGKHHRVSQFLEYATNNEAEYIGLIVGLTKAKELGIKQLEIKGDSNLVINQMQGKWKVKSDRLQPLYASACNLMAHFPHNTITWIPRQQNTLADREVNKCLDGVNES